MSKKKKRNQNKEHNQNQQSNISLNNDLMSETYQNNSNAHE